jgi:multiple sugar transport system permease protein
MSRLGQQDRAAAVFLAPALGLLLLFFLVPVLFGMFLSLTDFDVYAIGAPDTARLVGLDNYRSVLGDSSFWQALRNTVYFVTVGGPLSVLTSLGVALLLSHRLLRLGGLFRTIYFAPVVTTLVAVAIVWRYLYHPRYGLIDHILLRFGVDPIDWLGDPHWAMPAIILLAVWKNFGYNMLIFVAGLQSIPNELYEAAAIDGASPWRRFLHVTVPGLRPTLLFVGLTTMIGYFQLFAEPYVMTQGGPLGATRSLVLHMYEQGFRWWRIGEASTLAVLLLLLTLIATLIQLALQRSPGRGSSAGRETPSESGPRFAPPPPLGQADETSRGGAQ